MWKKYMRSMQSLTYRKKYKCPNCEEYCLHIIHDSSCECENECGIEMGCFSTTIQEIVDKDDFNGYYTSSELEDCFWEVDDDQINSCFKQICDVPLLNEISKKQKQKIETLYYKTIKIDERLDDIVIQHSRNSSEADHSKLNNFSYVINLIEDIHHFLNTCCNDIILFYYGIKLANEHFYSGRFFYNNLIDHLVLADERIYVFLAIYYDYKFSNELCENRTYSIKKYLTPKSTFKMSSIKSILDKIHGSYNISERRECNTHDINFINKKAIENITKDPNQFVRYNKDGDQVDRDILKVEIQKLIPILEQYYEALSCLLDMIDEQLLKDVEFFERKYIPMLNIFLDDIEKTKLTSNRYSSDFFEQINEKQKLLIYKPYVVKSVYLVDLFFRINEVVHCIADIYNLSGNMFYIDWQEKGIDERHIKFIDNQYLLYSCVMRLFSCYDKIEKSLSKMKSSSDVDKIIKNNDIISEKLHQILNCKDYLLLVDIRNKVFHNLRLGCLAGKEGLNYFDQIMIQVVFENTNIILDFVDFLISNYFLDLK